MTEWKDVLQLVTSTLGGQAGDCILEFLKVLPEEVTEGRKINLSVRSLEASRYSFVAENLLEGQKLTAM